MAKAARSALGFYRDKSSRAKFLPQICETIGLQKAYWERSAQTWGLVEIPQKPRHWATDAKRGLVKTSQSLLDETNTKKRACRGPKKFVEHKECEESILRQFKKKRILLIPHDMSGTTNAGRMGHDGNGTSGGQG